MYSLGFSRISEDTLGTFLLRFCAIFGTKLGGVLLFRVSFEKDVWLLVSRLGGWLMARQEQQQRRNSKSSSSSISGRQHQQRQLQLQLPPSFTAMVFPCPGPTFLQQPAGSQYYTVLYIRRPRQTQGGARQGIILLTLVSDYYRSRRSSSNSRRSKAGLRVACYCE